VGVAAPEGRKPWSVERRSWLIAFVIALFSAMLLHLGHDLDEKLWAQALGDLLVGLSLVMLIAGGRGGYGVRSTLPLAVGVAILAPAIGYLSDPNGHLGKVFGALEFFVVGMAIAAFVIGANRKAARDDSRSAETTHEQ
jgi:hypothetical protein